MVFSILVTAAPVGGSGAAAALRFAGAALAAGHQVRQVFFHGDGVGELAAHGLGGAAPDLDAGWAALAATHGFPLLACETALARRGLDRLAATGAVRPGTLGQFMVALADAGRVVQFRD
jgi:tRNA 2-thiouridine synthesizing protein D